MGPFISFRGDTALAELEKARNGTIGIGSDRWNAATEFEMSFLQRRHQCCNMTAPRYRHIEDRRTEQYDYLLQRS